MNNEFHTGNDISTINKHAIPDHTLLVGGFPCQDYSVAHTLSSSHGIEGKKGVLWWQIRDTIIAKKPPFCIFENVDRLLKSPAKQRGRDFGIILACLAKEGYSDIAFPDPWNKSSRTILTSETTLNRSSHVVTDPETKKLRLLTPIETERLQGFDDEWTNTGMSNRMRYFCMDNALVVPMITKMGRVLDTLLTKEK